MVQSGHVPIAVVRFCLVVKIYLLTSTSQFGPHPLSQPIIVMSPFPESKAAGVWIWRPISVQCHPDLLSCPRTSSVRDHQSQAQTFFLRPVPYRLTFMSPYLFSEWSAVTGTNFLSPSSAIQTYFHVPVPLQCVISSHRHKLSNI
jgi:hypothetical protein